VKVTHCCLFLLAGWSCAESPADTFPDLPGGAQAVSLLGDTLYPVAAAADVQQQREQELADARAAYEAQPDDADAIIWLGRRAAYLGNYREAVRIFSEGMDKHPDDARMYRHRGHRFITLRMFDPAVVDLNRAAELTEGAEDEFEPDGQPNERNIPTSTLQTNIYYHLGLAYYLQADYANALEAYRACLERSKNPDMLVATSHWLYMTLRRMERDDEAAAVLEAIDADMDVIENHAYHRLLLMYKGELEPEALLGSDDDAVQSATLAYGVANWHFYNGRESEALELFQRILEGEGWAAFGYIAAEAELAAIR